MSIRKNEMNAEAAMDDLYRSVIMEHYRDPGSRGTVEGADLVAEGKNPLCGDEVRLELRSKNGRIEEAAFTGEGCAISMAAASMFAKMLPGRTLEEVADLIRDFTRFIKGDREGLDEASLEELTALEGVSRFPMRIKCALLPFTAVEGELKKE